MSTEPELVWRDGAEPDDDEPGGDQVTVWIDPETRRVTFRVGPSPFEEIHVLLREEGGERLLEIEGGSRIEIRPRAANMVHVTLKDQ